MAHKDILINLDSLTKQKDHSEYSDRYGCASTCLINIVEITRRFPATDRETDSIYGNWDRTGNVTVCNYEQVGYGWSGIRNDHLPPVERWHEDNDQMSHCRIQSWQKALKDAFWSLDVAWGLYKPSLFEILKYSGRLPGGTKIPSHFCLWYDGEIINPDPGIDISHLEIVERFRI